MTFENVDEDIINNVYILRIIVLNKDFMYFIYYT